MPIDESSIIEVSQHESTPGETIVERTFALKVGLNVIQIALQYKGARLLEKDILVTREKPTGT